MSSKQQSLQSKKPSVQNSISTIKNQNINDDSSDIFKNKGREQFDQQQKYRNNKFQQNPYEKLHLHSTDRNSQKSTEKFNLQEANKKTQPIKKKKRSTLSPTISRPESRSKSRERILNQMLDFQNQYFNKLKKQLSTDNVEDGGFSTQKIESKVMRNLLQGKYQLEGQLYKKPNPVDEHMMDRMIIKTQKQREILQNNLNQVKQEIDLLQSQRIENPKSLYSHPILKLYLDDQEKQKQQQASIFVEKIQQEQHEYRQQRKKMKKELEDKHKQQELLQKKREVEDKMEKQKKREQEFKLKIQKIKENQVKRLQELADFEQKYLKKKNIITQGQKPLHIRWIRKYKNILNKQRQKKHQELRKTLKTIAELNLKDHVKNYQENLQRLQDELKQKREEKLQQYSKKEPKIEYVSDKWRLTEQIQLEEKVRQKEKEQQIRQLVQARINFGEGIREHQTVMPNRQREMELQILIDKRENPKKYIQRVHKKEKDDWLYEMRMRQLKQQENGILKKEQMVYAEQVFKSYTPSAPSVEYQNPKEVGNQYLLELKQQSEKIKSEKIIKKNMINLTNSASHTALLQNNNNINDDGDQYNQSFNNNVDDQYENYKNPNIFAVSHTPSLNQQSNTPTELKKRKRNINNKTEQRYEEMKQRMSIDKRLQEQMDWERYESDIKLPPIAKSVNLKRISNKLDEEAFKKEQILKHRTHNSLLTVKDVEDFGQLDDMYCNSIKAKIAFLKVNQDQVSLPKTPAKKTN